MVSLSSRDKYLRKKSDHLLQTLGIALYLFLFIEVSKRSQSRNERYVLSDNRTKKSKNFEQIIYIVFGK